MKSEADQHGKICTVESDKEADVALISLKAADGRGALPVFTSIPKLTAWHKSPSGSCLDATGMFECCG